MRLAPEIDLKAMPDLTQLDIHGNLPEHLRKFEYVGFKTDVFTYLRTAFYFGCDYRSEYWFYQNAILMQASKGALKGDYLEDIDEITKSEYITAFEAIAKQQREATEGGGKGRQVVNNT